uniref:LAGLIDADG endonuclease n=1 Tax=Ophiocordycipitaceae sp. TaxID=1907519 RepID=A0A7S8CTZ2_9HYPO|nr:LAGLIDADG endonuclease [Ophiocordycipitaceae sp.]QUT09504.1 LAGLIDADG endonuclease [Ophiocordycipitaceae sp.]QUT09532.1 LAGLIDADG endonuclease [Ophiocordycipitaceae sp.]QUT13262.1 LAGLIDADG endonuclease [Ophiocordycipitaceae sp.]DAJ12173.1 TPA_asm: LAGLIDADG endonuclease [Ophiocordycipitaceae sp.]
MYRGKLSNSGEALKLLTPSIYWKINSGCSNYACKVITQNIMGNRGSKSMWAGRRVQHCKRTTSRR